MFPDTAPRSSSTTRTLSIVLLETPHRVDRGTNIRLSRLTDKEIDVEHRPVLNKEEYKELDLGRQTRK